jgi:hypothetical protein
MQHIQFSQCAQQIYVEVSPLEYPFLANAHSQNCGVMIAMESRHKTSFQIGTFSTCNVIAFFLYGSEVPRSQLLGHLVEPAMLVCSRVVILHVYCDLECHEC